MSNALRIYEIYGGGGNAGAPYSNDYVTIYNSSNTSIDLSGYHLQYSSAAGSFNTSLQVNLSGAISGHGYYLIQLASNSSNGQMLPTADVSNLSVNLSANTGKLALVSGGVLTGSVTPSTPGVVDFVGYGGSASASEGATAVSPGSRNSITRLLEGGQDTDNNANDFVFSTPAPRNSASPHNTVPCYVTGTLILTARGEVPVEALGVGDLVVTASGAHRPIRWIGHRRTDCARHPDPIRVMPVRIKAGAVAPGMPARDLRVSPDHAIALDGVLVKATHLVNGVSILRENVPSVTYWHIELDSHDLLVADGMPAESYIEADNRMAFENAGMAAELHPDFAAKGDYASRTCLPLVEGGDALQTIRAGLFARVADRFTADADVKLLADGVVLVPTSTDGQPFRFDIPEGVTSLRLVSRSAIASEVQGDVRDHRRFGIMIGNLYADGVRLSFDDLGEGWNTQAEGRDHRWTDGDAVLSPARAIAFTMAALERYPLADYRAGACRAA